MRRQSLARPVHLHNRVVKFIQL